MLEDQLKQARILIIDDQADSVELLEVMLRLADYTNLTGTTDPLQGLSLYAGLQPDLILLDMMMPHLDGLQVMAQIRPLLPPAAYLPILVLTADTDPDKKRAALAQGASDFLTKPFDHTEALLRIKNLLQVRFLHLRLQQQNHILELEVRERKRVAEEVRRLNEGLEQRVAERTVQLEVTNRELKAEIIERKRAEDSLLYNALYDALTSLPNRTLLEDRLAHSIGRFKRQPQPAFAVLFIDLDRFKLINDSLGHGTGDQLLIAIARRLESCVRPGDTVARLGGDEFVILLENVEDITDATQVADRVHKELASPLGLRGQEMYTSASIGIVLGAPAYDTPGALLRDADIAMYRAKALGKARYVIFDEAMHTRARELMELETELRRALEQQEFRLHYQPILSLDTNRIIGLEALVRWQSPRRGLIPPEDFISLAEEIGLILPLGQWVLREACRQTQAWQEQFGFDPPLSISVNLSSKQFTQADLVQQIEQILHETGLDPRSLALEITESMLMDNAESAIAMLQRLRKPGIQVSVDDFGTGYSSLSYLHRLPLDTLKIDRSFVSAMENQGNLEIVRSIVMLAHNLSLNVTAEGVETAGQVEELKKLHCEYGQGFTFAHPLGSEAVEELFTRNNGSQPHTGATVT